jgi:hypothetical protein
MRILDPAVKELKEKSNLVINWRAIKKGRSVDRLEFTFEEVGVQTGKPTAPLAETKALVSRYEKRIYGVPVSEIEKLARPGESYEGAAMRIAKERGTK